MAVNYDHGAMVVVGRIRGVFGVKGEVRVEDYSRQKGDILHYDTWVLRLEGGWIERRVTGRLHQKGVVCQIEGYDDRDQARTLTDVDVAVTEEQLDPLEPGEYYWHQLQGLEVINHSGDNLGKVDRLIETGANDVMVLTGDQERLIPYVAGITQVDLTAGLIKGDWEKDY